MARELLEDASVDVPRPPEPTRLIGRRWALSPERDGLCHLLADLRRKGQHFSAVVVVLGLAVPDFLMPRSLVAVAVRAGSARKLARGSLRLYGAVASDAEEVRLGSTRSAALVRRSLPRRWDVRSMWYSADGSTLALAYDDTRAGSAHLRLQLAASAKVLRKLGWPKAALMAAAHSPDDRALAVSTRTFSRGTFDSHVYLTHACSHSPMRRIAFPDRTVCSLSFSRGGQRVALLLYRHRGRPSACEVLLLAADSLAVAFRAKVSLERALACPTVAVSPGTGNLWVTDVDQSFYMIDASRPGFNLVARSQKGACNSMECYRSCGLVAMSFFYEERREGRVRLFDERSWSFLASARLPYHVSSMAHEPRGSQLVAQCCHHSRGDDICLLILDAHSLDTLWSLPIDGAVLAVAPCISSSFAEASAAQAPQGGHAKGSA